jgi:hypothetical protein
MKYIFIVNLFGDINVDIFYFLLYDDPNRFSANQILGVSCSTPKPSGSHRPISLRWACHSLRRRYGPRRPTHWRRVQMDSVTNIVTKFLGRGTGSRYVVRYLREIFTLRVENEPVNLGRDRRTQVEGRRW